MSSISCPIKLPSDSTEDEANFVSFVDCLAMSSSETIAGVSFAIEPLTASLMSLAT
ncbi:hypothetical protein D3C84_1016980 [compost metagenome]